MNYIIIYDQVRGERLVKDVEERFVGSQLDLGRRINELALSGARRISVSHEDDLEQDEPVAAPPRAEDLPLTVRALLRKFAPGTHSRVYLVDHLDDGAVELRLQDGRGIPDYWTNKTVRTFAIQGGDLWVYIERR